MLWFVNTNQFPVVQFIADVLYINCAGIFHKFLQGCSHWVCRSLLVVGENISPRSAHNTFLLLVYPQGYSGLAASSSSMASAAASSSSLVTHWIIVAEIIYFILFLVPVIFLLLLFLLFFCFSYQIIDFPIILSVYFLRFLCSVSS